MGNILASMIQVALLRQRSKTVQPSEDASMYIVQLAWTMLHAITPDCRLRWPDLWNPANVQSSKSLKSAVAPMSPRPETSWSTSGSRCKSRTSFLPTILNRQTCSLKQSNYTSKKTKQQDAKIHITPSTQGAAIIHRARCLQATNKYCSEFRNDGTTTVDIYIYIHILIYIIIIYIYICKSHGAPSGLCWMEEISSSKVKISFAGWNNHCQDGS